MAKSTHRLNAIKAANVKTVGMHPDGAGLYLKVGCISPPYQWGENVLPLKKKRRQKGRRFGMSQRVSTSPAWRQQTLGQGVVDQSRRDA